jgi:hypothetical protein
MGDVCLVCPTLIEFTSVYHEDYFLWMDIYTGFQPSSISHFWQFLITVTSTIYDIVTCRWVCVSYRRALNWMIGFIHALSTQLVTTINYSAIAIFTLYSSLLHILVSSVFTDRVLATDLYQPHCHCSTYKAFFARHNYFLAISSQLFCQLPTPETLSILVRAA